MNSNVHKGDDSLRIKYVWIGYKALQYSLVTKTTHLSIVRPEHVECGELGV